MTSLTPMLPDYDRNQRHYHDDVYVMHSVDPRVLVSELLSDLAEDLNFPLPSDDKTDKPVDLYILPNFFEEDVHCVGFSYHGYERGRELFLPVEHNVYLLGREVEMRFDKDVVKVEWGCPGHAEAWKEADRFFAALKKSVHEEAEEKKEKEKEAKDKEAKEKEAKEKEAKEKEAKVEEAKEKESKEKKGQIKVDGYEPLVFYEQVDENDPSEGYKRYEFVHPRTVGPLQSIPEEKDYRETDDTQSTGKGDHESARDCTEGTGLLQGGVQKAEVDTQIESQNEKSEGHGKRLHEKERLMVLPDRTRGG